MVAGARQHPPAVVLVGFMGAGKSAVGARLATLLELPFLDSDAVIVATAGPIPQLFARLGERGFREIEADVVTGEIRALASVPKVLALGGGAVLSDDVRGALRHVRQVVWLTAPSAELWRRVAVDGADERPLAQDEGAFRALLARREPLYRQVATLTVETTGRAPGEIAGYLASRVTSEGAAGDAPAPEEGAA
jgi:shikimate kinase